MDYVLGIVADMPVEDRKAIADKILADIERESRDDGYSENGEYFEEIAKEIFDNIEHIKHKFSEFDWHGDKRDRRFFAFKLAIDAIWDRVRKYRAECWEMTLKQEAKRVADNMIYSDPF